MYIHNNYIIINAQENEWSLEDKNYKTHKICGTANTIAITIANHSTFMMPNTLCFVTIRKHFNQINQYNLK